MLSWLPGGAEPKFLPVMCVTRRDYDGEIVEVRTKMGRRVRGTPDHPFVVTAATTRRRGQARRGELDRPTTGCRSRRARSEADDCQRR